jgi:hypothetical protein
MHYELTPEQASELDTLMDSTLRDLSYEIAATDNSQYRAMLIERRNLLRTVADALGTPSGDTERGKADARLQADPRRVWTVEVTFTETDDRTRADARLHEANGEWHGSGRARRNPVDPDIPMIGEELAAARALSDLSHHLLNAAADKIESFEGRPVRLHS